MALHGWTPAQIIELTKNIGEGLSALVIILYALRNSHNSVPKSVAQVLLDMVQKPADTTTQPVGTTVINEHTTKAVADTDDAEGKTVSTSSG